MQAGSTRWARFGFTNTELLARSDEAATDQSGTAARPLGSGSLAGVSQACRPEKNGAACFPHEDGGGRREIAVQAVSSADRGMVSAIRPQRVFAATSFCRL